MFLRYFGWVVATGGRKGDKGGKGGADVSRPGDEGRPRTAATGTRGGDARRAERKGRRGGERKGERKGEAAIDGRD